MARTEWSRWAAISCWWMACGQRTIDLESGAADSASASTDTSSAEPCDGSLEYRCLEADFQRCTRTRTGTVWLTLQSCGSAELCGPLGGCLSPACEPNQAVCLGLIVRRCNADLTGFDEVESCTNAAYCYPDGCRTTPCAAGERRCNGARLEQCNSDRNGWDLVQLCPQSCNSAQLDCVVCEVGETRCNGQRLELCATSSDANAPVRSSSWLTWQDCGAAELCSAASSSVIAACLAPE